MKKWSVLLVVLLLSVFTCNFACAETKEITATGEYNMGESETLLVAKERAVYLAMQNAVEQAGVYVESYTQVINMAVAKDEVKMIASGIVEVIDKKYDRKISDTGGDFVRATITCKVNTDNVQSMIDKLQDKTKVADLKKIQADYANAMEEITALKKQLAQATTSEDKKQVIDKITQNEQNFEAIQWYEKGVAYLDATDWDASLKAYNKAIELGSKNIWAYIDCGNIYSYRGLTDKSQLNVALTYYNKALQLDSQSANAYYTRGIVYSRKGQLDLALADYNKALQLDSMLADVYAFRSQIYSWRGQSTLAAADMEKYYEVKFAKCNKEIQDNPQDAYAYDQRGVLYKHKEQYDLALADFNKALQVNPRVALVYLDKAEMCNLLGRKAEAIEAYKAYLAIAPVNKENESIIDDIKRRIKALGGTI